jgi:hypothetical protein
MILVAASGLAFFVAIPLPIATEAPWRAWSSTVTQFNNPCSGVLDGNLELATSRAQSLAADPDSGYAGRRTQYNLVLWPEDSVAATQDSVVCTRVDSLIGAWHATPAGQTSGVIRNQYWGPTAVVRVNPGKYYVAPGLEDDQRREYTFIVDSVGGSVQFFFSR